MPTVPVTPSSRCDGKATRTPCVDGLKLRLWGYFLAAGGSLRRLGARHWWKPPSPHNRSRALSRTRTLTPTVRFGASRPRPLTPTSPQPGPKLRTQRLPLPPQPPPTVKAAQIIIPSISLCEGQAMKTRIAVTLLAALILAACGKSDIPVGTAVSPPPAVKFVGSGKTTFTTCRRARTPCTSFRETT